MSGGGPTWQRHNSKRKRQTSSLNISSSSRRRHQQCQTNLWRPARDGGAGPGLDHRGASCPIRNKVKIPAHKQTAQSSGVAGQAGEHVCACMWRCVCVWGSERVREGMKKGEIVGFVAGEVKGQRGSASHLDWRSPTKPARLGPWVNIDPLLFDICSVRA